MLTHNWTKNKGRPDRDSLYAGISVTPSVTSVRAMPAQMERAGTLPGCPRGWRYPVV